jgi:cell wall-associated NlpC family hydrolase
MRGRGRRIARGALAVALAFGSVIAASALSSAEPSRQDLEAAKAKFDGLNREISLLVEEYNREQIQLQAIRKRLDAYREDAQAARTEARTALESLTDRAIAAYQDAGSELESLLSSGSVAEFSDRLEFMGQLAQADRDLATNAQAAQQRATWAAERLAEAAEEQSAVLARLRDKEAQIRRAADEAERIYESLSSQYREHQAALRAAAAASYQVTGVSPPPGGPPPAPNPNAQAAIDAAYSVIGTPYSWGSSSPDVGFDCSGLTMWAWAHAGVSLPHSSQAQYSAVPHVDPNDAQPGDLLFFYSPISHVGLYIGGGRMIDANHPGDVVNIRSVNWSYLVGVGRP